MCFYRRNLETLQRNWYDSFSFGLNSIRNETRDQHGDVVQVLIAELVMPRKAQPELHGQIN
jgi:hypothetical protein